MKRSSCQFFEPYRDDKTHRPHPTKQGVCTFPIQWPTLPNAFDRNPKTGQPNFPNRVPLFSWQCDECPCKVVPAKVYPMPGKEQELIPE